MMDKAKIALIEAALAERDDRIKELGAGLTQMSDAHRATAADLGEAKARIRNLEALLNAAIDERNYEASVGSGHEKKLSEFEYELEHGIIEVSDD